jgi:hypothetical protein
MSRDKTSQLPLLASLSQLEADPKNMQLPKAAPPAVPDIRFPGSLLFHQIFGRVEKETRPGMNWFT